MTSTRLYLVGTSHCYQYGAGAKRKVVCTVAQERAFRDFIRSLALQLKAVGLAEELNEEGLLAAEKSASVLQALAQELAVPHLLCEPSRSERAALGAHEETWIRSIAFMDEKTEAEVQLELGEQFRKRETVWLDRLESFALWPILFVCGADHVTSFSSRAAGRDVVVVLVHADWQG